MTPTPEKNIDPAELRKFSTIAHYWWDPQGPVKTLHDINPLRLQFILDHLSLEQKKVLDVGCGGGILSEALAQQQAEVTGIDADSSLIQMAKLHLHESKLKIHYVKTYVEDFSKQHHKAFDVITCMEMLEHVPDPDAIISHIAEMTKTGGYIFFSTLNRNFKSWLYSIVGAEYLLGLLPKGTHRYDKFITPAELHHTCLKYGLRLLEMKGINFNPISGQYSLTQDISVNYLCCFIKD